MLSFLLLLLLLLLRCTPHLLLVLIVLILSSSLSPSLSFPLFPIFPSQLNLCLRNIVDYKTYIRTNPNIRSDHLAKCAKFERGFGIVLKNAWTHAEAVQTTDLPLLLCHCGDVLATANGDKERVKALAAEGVLCERQEVVVMFYVRGLMKRIDDVGEDRVMPLMKEHRLFSSMLEFLSKWWKELDDQSLISAAEALALVCATEDFATFAAEHADEEDRAKLAELDEDEWLDEVCDEDDVRKKLRPLLDFTRKCKRGRK